MTTSDVSARTAWPADAAAIAEVQLRAWRQRYDDAWVDGLADRGLTAQALAEAWRATLARPPEARRRALVALAADQVTGFALTGPTVDEDRNPATDGEITELTVDPVRTGEGHGSRLLQACVDTLRADRFGRAVCWVDSTADRLRAFLEGAGWAPDGASRELADEASSRTLKQVRLHTDLASD